MACAGARGPYCQYQLVAAGLGWSILPGLALKRDRTDRVAVSSLNPRLERELGMVLRRDKHLTRGLRRAVAVGSDGCDDDGVAARRYKIPNLIHLPAGIVQPGLAQFPACAIGFAVQTQAVSRR